MNLGEILADVNEQVPNSFSDAEKVRWLNQIQRRLFREFPIPTKTITFTMPAGLAFYASLPSDFAFDTVKMLTVDGVPYDYAPISNQVNAPPKFWSMVDGNLFLYPTPSKAVTVVLQYVPRYAEMSASNLGAIPSLPEDYHELLSTELAIKVAKMGKDPALANNLTEDAKELREEARGKLNRSPKPRRIRAGAWY